MTVFIAFISIFAVVKLFPLSLELLKPPATYAIFAFIRFIFYLKFQSYIPCQLLNCQPPTRYLRLSGSFCNFKFQSYIPFQLLNRQSPSPYLHLSGGQGLAIVEFFFTHRNFSVLMAIFTMICVPETRGRSLAEIQSMYGEVRFLIFIFHIQSLI